MKNFLKDPQSKREFKIVSKKFADLMKKKVNAAINLLLENMRNGIVPLNNKTLKRLKLKYPQPKKDDMSALLTDIPERIHAAKFE